MTVFITGGTGFIGSRLALRCLERGDSVTVLGRGDATDAELTSGEYLRRQGVRVVWESILDRKRLFQVVKGAKLVVHMAAAQHEMNITNETFRAVNVEGTRNILDASREAGVDRFVHGSTIGVYGREIDCIVDENTELRPDNIYGVTKAEGEELVRTFFDRLPCTILRISETYGPGDRRLLKLFRAIDKGAFFMIGKGENIHQLIYVDDLVDGILLASKSARALNQTFVMAGRERLTSNDMANAIAAATETRLRKWRAPLSLFMLAAVMIETTMRPLGMQPPLHRRRMDFFSKSFRISTAKAEEDLRFVATTSFIEGARHAAEWYRSNGLL